MKDQPNTQRFDFAKEFKRFIDTMNAEATNEQTPLLRRLAAHLGGDPSTMPVVAEEFEHYEQPNVQVALDAMLGPEAGRSAEIVGIAVAHKRFGQGTLSDPPAASRARGPLNAGPVDY